MLCRSLLIVSLLVSIETAPLMLTEKYLDDSPRATYDWATTPSGGCCAAKDPLACLRLLGTPGLSLSTARGFAVVTGAESPPGLWTSVMLNWAVRRSFNLVAVDDPTGWGAVSAAAEQLGAASGVLLLLPDVFVRDLESDWVSKLLSDRTADVFVTLAGKTADMIGTSGSGGPFAGLVLVRATSYGQLFVSEWLAQGATSGFSQPPTLALASLLSRRLSDENAPALSVTVDQVDWASGWDQMAILTPEGFFSDDHGARQHHHGEHSHDVAVVVLPPLPRRAFANIVRRVFEATCAAKPSGMGLDPEVVFAEWVRAAQTDVAGGQGGDVAMSHLHLAQALVRSGDQTQGMTAIDSARLALTAAQHHGPAWAAANAACTPEVALAGALQLMTGGTLVPVPELQSAWGRAECRANPAISHAMIASSAKKQKVEVLRQAVTAAPWHVGLSFDLATRLLLERSHHAEASVLLRRIVHLDEFNGDAWANLGLTLHSMQDPGASASAYRRALDLNINEEHRAQHGLGRSLLLLGQAQPAVIELEKALRNNPRPTATLFTDLGDARMATGDIQGAIQAFKSCLQRHPRTSYAREKVHMLQRSLNEERGDL